MMLKENKIGFAWPLMALALVMLVMSGCQSTHELDEVEKSGFLGDYSKLHKGKAGEPRLYYAKDGLDLSPYDKVLIAPVTLWKKGDSDLKDISEKDLQMLVSAFHHTLNKELRKKFTVVKDEGPGVLKIHVAITEADDANVTMDVLSSVLPQAMLIGGGVRLAKGTSSFCGTCQIEGEVLDSMSKKRFMACVDARGGEMFAYDKELFEDWGDVNQAFQFWAEALTKRLVSYK